jgi:hypothetical protein
MHPSQPYIKQLRRIHKEAQNLSSQQVEGRLRDAFGRALKDIPVELAEELFDFSLDRIRGQIGEGESGAVSGPDLVEAFLETAALVDLFGRDYDDEEDPLTEQEWQFIAEVVPDYGLEMDMATLEYVMSHLVERRML